MMDKEEIPEYLQLVEDLQLYELGDNRRLEQYYKTLKNGEELTDSDLDYLTKLDVSLQKIKKKQVTGTKPTKIIVVAVVCSVIAVFGVLFIIEMYNVYQVNSVLDKQNQLAELEKKYFDVVKNYFNYEVGAQQRAICQNESNMEDLIQCLMDPTLRSKLNPIQNEISKIKQEIDEMLN